ncbi:Hypothetical protein HVR_LOCUS997 [uncultured virus]|nr:Hypothetical protein HVR_LOCUS997 [uncultured virus]
MATTLALSCYGSGSGPYRSVKPGTNIGIELTQGSHTFQLKGKGGHLNPPAHAYQQSTNIGVSVGPISAGTNVTGAKMLVWTKWPQDSFAVNYTGSGSSTIKLHYIKP